MFPLDGYAENSVRMFSDVIDTASAICLITRVGCYTNFASSTTYIWITLYHFRSLLFCSGFACGQCARNPVRLGFPIWVSYLFLYIATFSLKLKMVQLTPLIFAFIFLPIFEYCATDRKYLVSKRCIWCLSVSVSVHFLLLHIYRTTLKI